MPAENRHRGAEDPALPLDDVDRAVVLLRCCAPHSVARWSNLAAIEVGGTPVKEFAQQKGLSSSNAAARVFRAREALKKRVAESCGTWAEHGCLTKSIFSSSRSSPSFDWGDPTWYPPTHQLL